MEYEEFTELKKSLIDTQDKIIVELSCFSPKTVQEFEESISPLIKVYSSAYKQIKEFIIAFDDNDITRSIEEYISAVEERNLRPLIKECLNNIELNRNNKLSANTVALLKNHQFYISRPRSNKA